MKISDLRKDIKILSDPLLKQGGFVETGQLGENIKVTKKGDKYAILFDEVRDKASFSISLRVLVYYKEIESVFESIKSTFPYTLNKILSCGSVSMDNYDINCTRQILDRMITKDADEYFRLFGQASLISTNLNSSDYTTWATADKVTQIKVRLASAIFESDKTALSAAIIAASKYTAQPWSLPDRDYINELCEKAQASI